MNVRVKELVFMLVLVSVHSFDALFPLCFPKSLDLVYFSFITHFNSIFIQVKFEFS
jgi:hypothetical protein